MNNERRKQNAMKDDENESVDLHIGKIIGIVFLGILIIVALICLFSSVYQINAGERGIVLRWGNPNPEPVSPGLHFKVPIADSIVRMNVQTQKHVVEKASAASKDLQTVTTDITVNYRIDEATVPIIYRNIGVQYQDKIIVPAVLEVVKANTAQYTAEELVSKRPEVKDKIDSTLRDRLREYNIIVEAVSITNFDFSPSFNAAIEAKVTAEQEALAQKNKVAQIEYMAQQKIAEAQGTKQAAILEAQGKAEAIRIQTEAIKAQGGAEYVQLQAIQKWDGKTPTMMMAGSSVPFINLNPATS